MDRTGEEDTRKKVLSLKDSCLKSISYNLSRYTEAFSTTDDADLKGNLEYLRRFHSLYLIEKNSDQYIQDESYFNFVINEYLDKLDFSLFNNRNWDAVLRQTVKVGHNFKTVHLSDNTFLEFEEGCNFVHEVVRNIPNVERLILSENCNDDTLETIASSCSELRELTIGGDSFSNEGLKSLCEKTRGGTRGRGPSLKALSLCGEDDWYEGVEFLLRNMPSLENVEYTYLTDALYWMHKDDRDIAQIKYNLLSLHINHDSSDVIADMLAVITEVCPRLTRLYLPNANGQCLDLITRFSELEDLRVTGNKLHVVDCNSFLESRGEGLRKLRMHQLQISADTLIHSCPMVEFLLFDEMSFIPLGQRIVLTSLYRLRELSFGNFNFKETLTELSVTAILKSSVNLRELQFINCKFDSPRWVVENMLKSCESTLLQKLSFYNCGIGEIALRTAFSTRLDSKNTQLVVSNPLWLRELSDF